jgi:hypothetical protein
MAVAVTALIIKRRGMKEFIPVGLFASFTPISGARLRPPAIVAFSGKNRSGFKGYFRSGQFRGGSHYGHVLGEILPAAPGGKIGMGLYNHRGLNPGGVFDGEIHRCFCHTWEDMPGIIPICYGFFSWFIWYGFYLWINNGRREVDSFFK